MPDHDHDHDHGHDHERRPLEDVFVLDSTVHGYNFRPENWVPGPFMDRIAKQLGDTLWAGHLDSMAYLDPRYITTRDVFDSGDDAGLLGSLLFAESDTDMCVYHGVPMYGIYADGGSPLSVGVEMRKRWPERVALYGPASPWEPGVLDTVERLITEEQVVGIKLYPSDVVDGKINSFRMDDPEVAYPILEQTRALGGKIVAMHKAIPSGQVPSEPFAVWDVSAAASAFPELTFEIVHGGFAYLEETASQISRFPNVTVNLETTAAFLLARQPARFAHLLGALLLAGGAERIFWSSGATARHPQPFLELFWDFEIPESMREEYGYPALTPDIKRDILGLNHARILGLDVAAKRETLAHDQFGLAKPLAEPWSGHD